jgi:hypothetical protein
MNHILLQLDNSQLINIIHSICANMDIAIRTGLDPGNGKPRVFADNRNIGTFTVLNLDAPLLQTYFVTCVSTQTHRLYFEVEAISQQQAIDYASQRDDGTLIIEPVDSVFISTESEDGWAANPVN